jgi:sigma-54 dependent transcriptional regulator, acetoin dehydrogenase operon transcriptional activator AcoR
MTAGGFARESVLSLLEGPQRHSPRDRAEALLAAIESVQQRTDLGQVAERAALTVVSLAAATAAVVYFEAAELGPQLAFAGGVSGTAAEALAAAVRDLVSSGNGAPYVLLAGATIVAAPFQIGKIRGAVLVERKGRAFDDADGRTLAQFGRHVGNAAASGLQIERVRRMERVEHAVLDALCEGVLIAVEGKIKVVNQAAARILSVDREATLGAPLHRTWPELAALVDAGEPLEEEPVRVGGKDLQVSLRRIVESKPHVAAMINFTERKPSEARARRPAAMSTAFGLDDLIGGSAALAGIRRFALVAAESSSSLLIEGESGSGKEVLAQAIHSGGPRRRSPFVAVHCAAIPRELLESELFGYEAGAFTGANPRGHAGKFELADGGTLLLDDVVELPLEMQAKLLRVLQEKSLTRLGASRSRPVDTRIIATSNIPLRDAVASNRFRSDLFYRLDVLHIVIPPLRERPEDIPSLCERFLRRYSATHGRQLRTLGAEALQALEAYSWPGNVRELEHWMENEIHFASPHAVCLERLTRRPVAVDRPPASIPVRPIREAEKDLYATAMGAASGSVSRAARALGVSRGKLYRKLRLYDLLPR